MLLILLISKNHCEDHPYVPEKKLKILFVLHEFPKFIQQFILNQITGLHDLGHDIYIYANKKVKGPIPPDIARYNLMERTFYKTVPKNQQDFDIIYCHFGPDGYCGLYLKKYYGLTGKVVTCFRGDDISKLLRSHPNNKTSKKRGIFSVPCYSPTMYDELFSQGDHFLPVCDYFRKKLLTLGCNKNTITVQHSGINTANFSYKKRRHKKKNEKLSIVTIGRLVEKKGIKYAIRAIARLIPSYPKLTYTIIGNGPLYKKLDLLIKRLGLEKQIILKGWLSQEDIKDYLYSADIFVLPAITAQDGDEEGISNVLKEAMATGLPVVTTRHSGIPELVKNNNSGYIVKEKSIAELGNKIEKLLKNPSKCISMGASGRSFVEKNFETSTLIIELSKLFEKLANTDIDDTKSI